MKINVKNNSTGNPKKLEILKEFLKFCQLHSPLKSEINVVFVNRTNEKFFDGNYLIPTKFTKLNEGLTTISKFWIEEFSKQRKINSVGIESQLLVKFFIENNPSVQKLLNI
jgi:hypothetical protein